MKLLVFSRITQVTVKVLPVYVCRCGAEECGSTARLELDHLPTEEEMLNSISVSHIPEGWACYGRNDVRCPKCIT